MTRPSKLPIASRDLKTTILESLAQQSLANRRGPRPSSAGSCPRSIYYDWTKAPALYTEEQLLAPLIGTGLHSVIEGLFENSEVSVRIDCPGFEMRGLIDLAEDDCVTDWKVTGYKSWSRIKNKPKGEHVDQVNLYAFGASKPRWRIVYIDLLGMQGIEAKYLWRERNYAFLEIQKTLNLIVYCGETDHDKALQTIGKFEDVQRYVLRGEEPPRPFEEPDRFPCSWCPYKKHCWQDA